MLSRAKGLGFPKEIVFIKCLDGLAALVRFIFLVQGGEFSPHLVS